MDPRTPSRTTRAALAAAAVAAIALGLGACSSGSDAGTASGSSTPGAGTGSAISAERCAENEAAGPITFLTGYNYQASASILEVIAADELGYFDDLCLDVTIQPGTGDTGLSNQLLAAGQVQFAAVSQQDVITAQDNGVDVKGISSYSDAGLEILMTETSVKDLKELDGTILGQKGNLPVTVEAMLAEAGADVASIQQVTVGYDPSVLPRGQVNSLTGFISNEPALLEAAGDEVTVWRPYDYDVPGSLGALAVNPAFADENPTAVEDFLRGSFHAFEYCADEANSAECVDFAATLAGDTYDAAHNAQVWATEVGVIDETKTAGTALGTIDLANVDAIAELLNEYDILSAPLDTADAESYFDPSFVEAISDGDQIVWPAP